MLHEISEFDLYLLTRVICIYLPIYDGIWNRKTYFEITSILNLKKRNFIVISWPYIRYRLHLFYLVNQILTSLLC